MAAINLQSLHKHFGDFVAVDDIDMHIKTGEFFVLLGPSGCGKTTTLRMIAGLELPTSGQIYLDEEDVTNLRASKRDIAFVFQLFALYPHMNVFKNLAFPLKSQSVSRRDTHARVIEIAKLLRIEHILNKPIGGLAGGDRQRVALGRAIIRRPKAFLMDEPLGTLDTEFRELMCEELRQLHTRIAATTIYVTHDQIEAMIMADRIAVMNNGKVLQVGSPTIIYNQPNTKFVAHFIGSPAMNFLNAQGGVNSGEHSVQVNGAEILVPQLHESINEKEITLGARPEHIELSDQGDIRGEVFEVEYMGARKLVTVETNSGKVKVRASNTAQVKRGENIGLSFKTDRLVLFDNKTERAYKSELIKESNYG